MKGMQKIKRGSGFRGALNYGFENEKGLLDGELIGGNMSGTDPKSLAREFGVARKLRPDIDKPVWHNSLRLPEGDKLDKDKWEKMADDYMRRMGFTEAHQRVYQMHDEPTGQHIHIIANRISLEGKIYLGQNENPKSTRIIQKLERDYGLTQTKGPDNLRGKNVMPDVKRPTAGEVGKRERTGETPERYALAKLIDTAIADKPTASAFAERLALAGVEVRANFNKGGLNGFSFSLNGIPFKGSQLGKQYTGQALLDRGLSYVEDRDYAQLRAITAASTGIEQRDAAAKDPGAAQPVSPDRSVDSTTARDADDLRGADSGADRADHRADHADPESTAGRAERPTDERRDADAGTEASHETDSPETGASVAGNGEERPGPGTERPAVTGSAVAPSREPGHQSHDTGGGISSGVEITDAGLITTGDKGTDELLRASHQGRMKLAREALSRQKSQHAKDMADAKKRHASLDKPHTNRLTSLASRSMDSLWREMEIQRFAQALGGQKFQVTCSPANAKAKPITKVYTAEQMQSPKVLKELAHLSARNYQINVQPNDGAGLILLRGLDDQDIEKLHAAGLPPAAVVQFAGKAQAWIATGEKLSADERTALTKRIEALVGLDKKAGMAGRMVGFAGASLSARPGQVAPAAAEILGEVLAEIFEAKAQADQAQAAKLLASAIEKNVVVNDHDFVDVGGIKSLRKGWLQSACGQAISDQSLFLVSMSAKFDPAQVERGVIAAMSRQDVTAEQAYRAVYAGSSVFAGKDLEAAQFVTDTYIQADFEADGRSLEGVDVRAEARKLYPDLIAHAERGTDSEMKAMDEKMKAEGNAEQLRLDDQAEQHRLEVAARIAAEALLKVEGETYD